MCLDTVSTSKRRLPAVDGLAHIGMPWANNMEHEHVGDAPSSLEVDGTARKSRINQSIEMNSMGNEAPSLVTGVPDKTLGLDSAYKTQSHHPYMDAQVHLPMVAIR
jgi:hypothetical protein